MNVMGALILIKQNPKELGEHIRTCDNCKHSRIYYEIVDVNGKKRIVYIKGDYVRCSKIARNLSLSENEDRYVTVHKNFADICPFFDKR